MPEEPQQQTQPGEGQKPGQGGGQSQPAVNLDSLADTVKDRLFQEFDARRQRELEVAQAAEAERQRQLADAQTRQAQPDYIRAAREAVAPDIQDARLRALAAEDKAMFYQKTPQALKYETEIETRFQRLYQQGIPFTRQDLWHHLRGERFEEFSKDAAEKAAKAAEGVDVGPSEGGPVRQPRQAKAALEATDEELDKWAESRTAF